MGYVKNATKDITLADGTATIRKLSARSLDKAREAEQISGAQRMGYLSEGAIRGLFGSPEARKLEQDKAEGKKPSFDEARKARYGQYDRGLVLQQGTLRWSYSDTVPTDPADVVDDETAQVIHEAILDFSLRPIDPAEYEAERGKGFESSTVS